MTLPPSMPRRGAWRPSRRQILRAAVPFGLALTAGCSVRPTPGTGPLVAWPARNEWPEYYRDADPEIQEAYRYAIANKPVLQYMPCYCGCIDDGHESNYDCYVREVRPDGSVVLDPMSFG